MSFRTAIIVVLLAGLVAMFAPVAVAGEDAGRETVFIPLIEISPGKSIPIVGSSALRLNAVGIARWGSPDPENTQVGRAQQEGGWETDLDFEPSVNLDHISIPFLTNDAEALRFFAPRLFSALGMIPILVVNPSSQIRSEELGHIDQIGVDFFDRLVFVYGPRVPTAVLDTPKIGGAVRVLDVDSMGIHLPFSSIVELVIGSRRAYVVWPNPELFTSNRPAVAKVPVMVWGDNGKQVFGGGWSGTLVNDYSIEQNQLIVSSNIGYFDDYDAKLEAIDCGSKHYQLSLLDPRSRDPAVLQMKARFSYHSQDLRIDGLSLDLFPTRSFQDNVLCCQRIFERDSQEYARFGKGKWNDSHSQWIYTGTPDGYFRASWDVSLLFWRHVSDLLSANERDVISIGKELTLALGDPSIASDEPLENTSVPRELGAFDNKSLVRFVELMTVPHLN